MVHRNEPTLEGVIPFREARAEAGGFPNRYAIREDDRGRYLTCLEAPNVAVRVERGFTVSGSSARKYPECSIFLDGAAQGEPFMDVKRKVYNLDHHEGCVRPFTLSTCEQAMVLVRKGLDLREGDWGVYANEPDLDTVLAIWVLLNHLHLVDENPDVRLRLMPILRLQGIIDVHGLELRDLSGLPRPIRKRAQDVIDALRREEVALKQAGDWQSVDFLEYTAGVLRAVDETLYSHRQFEDLQDVDELTRLPIAKNRLAVVCRADVGVYEVEEYLKKLHGERLGVLVLQKEPSTYTLRLVDSFLPITLDPIYERLNQLEPNLSGDARWGGSADIGGSPRGRGTGLSPQQIAEVCQWVFRPPSLSRRLAALVTQVGVVAVVIALALLTAFRGIPSGPFPGALADVTPEIQITFGAAVLVVALALLVPALRQRRLAQYGFGWPRGVSWLALLPVGFVGALAGGGWGPVAPAWSGLTGVGLLVGILAAELLFRGAIYGRLVGLFSIERPGGGWSVSTPNAVTSLLYAGAIVGLFFVPSWGLEADPGEATLLMAGAALVLGLTCGLARERSGSLLASFVIHASAVGIVWAGARLIG